MNQTSAARQALEIQPYLFEVMQEQLASDQLKQSGKAVVDKLLKVRRTMEGTEANFIQYVNASIEEIRSIISLTIAEKEERVLFAIERSGATTLKEISEDCRLSIPVTKEILSGLGKKDLVYAVKKYIPGSDRPNFMFKSRRVNCPEADEVIKRDSPGFGRDL